jgi:hypothetical protein
MSSARSRDEDVAVTFAQALVDGDYARAHALLAPALRDEQTAADLRTHLHAMFEEYADGEPERVAYDAAFAMKEWPGKLAHDLCHVYVGIEGGEFVEGVSLVVAEIDGQTLIRAIEWGRP